jgi:linoleate 10R-lipoxygenase
MILTLYRFNEASYDHSVDQSHVMYKLVLQAFPRHVQPNSVYAHFPMTIPSETKLILDKLDKGKNYSWDKPSKISNGLVK